MAPLQDGQKSCSVPHPPIHLCNINPQGFPKKKVSCVLIKTNGNPFSLQYVLKTMFEFDWGWCKLIFLMKCTGIHEPEKIRFCFIKKMCFICFDYLVGSRRTYFRPQFTQSRRKNCVCFIWWTLSRCLRSCQNHLVEKWREWANVYLALSGGCH